MQELANAVFVVLYLLVLGAPVWLPIAIYIFHQRSNPPVQVMTIEELQSAGFSAKEAIIEQRRQRFFAVRGKGKPRLNHDVHLLHTMEASAARARLQLLNDPSALIALTIGAPRPDMAAYWSTLRVLRTQVRAAAGAHWALLNARSDWSAMLDLARRWTRAQCGLARLFLGGSLRCCGVVGVVDYSTALRAIATIT